MHSAVGASISLNKSSTTDDDMAPDLIVALLGIAVAQCVILYKTFRNEKVEEKRTKEANKRADKILEIHFFFSENDKICRESAKIP